MSLDPETSRNYEAGIKWRSPNRVLSVGVNLYKTKYKDLQTATPGAIDGVDGFSNFGDATSKGIDYEVRWNTPLDGVSMGLVGNINSAEFDRVEPAVQAALPLFSPGSRLVNSIQ